jgi:hypothetical protein
MTILLSIKLNSRLWKRGTTTVNRKQSWQILELLSKVLRKMTILLSIKMNRLRNWCRNSKGIIWNDWISRDRRDLNVIETKRWNERWDRLMRSAMVLRAV